MGLLLDPLICFDLPVKLIQKDGGDTPRKYCHDLYLLVSMLFLLSSLVGPLGGAWSVF